MLLTTHRLTVKSKTFSETDSNIFKNQHCETTMCQYKIIHIRMRFDFLYVYMFDLSIVELTFTRLLRVKFIGHYGLVSRNMKFVTARKPEVLMNVSLKYLVRHLSSRSFIFLNDNIVLYFLDMWRIYVAVG